MAANVMNSQLELLNQWTINSKMKLNYLKSTVMWFRVSKRNQRPCPPIMLGGIVLKAVTKQKYLGLVFDESLSWDHHVSLLCKRMSYYLYVICCHRNVLGCKLLKLLTESLVLSHLNYCLPVWGVLLHTQSLQRLKRMQNRAEALIQYRSLCLMHHQFRCITL